MLLLGDEDKREGMLGFQGSGRQRENENNKRVVA